MPQFDPSSFASQLFWLVVSFAALYWVVAKFAIPRIGDVLEKRDRVIQDDLDRAESLKQEADAAIEAYEASIAEARSKAHQSVKAIQDEMNALAAEENAKVDGQVASQLEEAETRIESAKAEAMASVKSIAAEVVQDTASKIAGISVDGGAAETAVTNELGAKG